MAKSIDVSDLDIYYGDFLAVEGVNMTIRAKSVTAFIGPSGCGKSTFLRSLNRMNDTVASARVTGTILLDGEDIYAPSMDVVQLRARVGMVFQKPNPFPKSIYDNVGYGPRIHGLAPSKADLDVIVERALVRAGLWDEVKDRLGESGTALSGELVEESDFFITLRHSDGPLRTIRKTPGMKIAKVNPLQGHIDLLDRITDTQIHDVVAYLARMK